MRAGVRCPATEARTLPRRGTHNVKLFKHSLDVREGLLRRDTPPQPCEHRHQHAVGQNTTTLCVPG